MNVADPGYGEKAFTFIKMSEPEQRPMHNALRQMPRRYESDTVGWEAILALQT